MGNQPKNIIRSWDNCENQEVCPDDPVADVDVDTVGLTAHMVPQVCWTPAGVVKNSSTLFVTHVKPGAIPLSDVPGIQEQDAEQNPHPGLSVHEVQTVWMEQFWAVSGCWHVYEQVVEALHFTSSESQQQPLT